MKVIWGKVMRLRIEGDMSERARAFAYCEAHEYRITRSGGYPLEPGRIDPNRFLILAEREEELPEAVLKKL